MNRYSTRFEALMAVRASFRTEQEMADAFHVSQPTVWRWINQSKQLPPHHVLAAEAATGVSRHALRPDIYPPEVPNAPPAWHGVDRGETCVTFQTDSVLHRNAEVAAAA